MPLNQFHLIGRIVRDHNLQELPNGSKVLNFTIAQNKKWKDQSGATVEKPLYFEVTAFGRVAEVLAQYTHKWSKIYVGWDMENNNHEKTKDDGTVVKTYGFRFTVKEFEFLDSREKQDTDNEKKEDGGPESW